MTMMNKRLIFPAALACFALLALTGALAQHTPEPPPEQIWRAARQYVTVDDFPAKGLILDIGGGGEGVIGQLKGQQVIAIDYNKRELMDAPPGPLVKIVMDARELTFLDNTFPTATVFFTFMYIAPADHEQVFRELYRVMAPGGQLLIWDAVFPNLEDKRKKFALMPFTFKLPDREIQTGYGTYLPPGGQGLPHFEELAFKTGFSEVSKKTAQEWFFLELSKPGPAK